MQPLSKNSIYLLACISLIIACNDQPKQAADALPSTNSPVSCYLSVNNRDTVRLKTVTVGTDVTGTLEYNHYEKDQNNGTITGEMKGELLVVDYRFTSEGVQSIRQVVFKKQEDQFVEGYGASEDMGGKMKFKNIDSLDFSHSIPLLPINCQ